MKLERKRIRLAIDTARPASDRIKDVFTSETPSAWRGNDIQFELGVFIGADLVTDISNYASLTIRILSGPLPSDASLVSKTLTSGELLGTLTALQWTAKTHQHATVAFTSAETSPVLAAGELSKVLWVVISVVTNDSPGRDLTLGVTQLTIYEDGENAQLSTAEQATLHYTQAEADARFVQKHEDLAAERFHNGRWHTYDPDTDLWYPEVLVTRDGVRIKVLADEGVEL